MAHYLDDFITVRSPGSPECQTNLGIMLATCQRLGIPVALALGAAEPIGDHGGCSRNGKVHL